MKNFPGASSKGGEFVPLGLAAGSPPDAGNDQGWKSADKPGSVVGSHSSGRRVTTAL